MAAKYTMSLDMRVLQHLGIRLYSNVAAVISELVANSWDAEATEVRIRFDGDDRIFISDNGNGMTVAEINSRFLNVGYEKRKEEGEASPNFKRDFMGRKGIGKLSVLSMAKVVDIYSTSGDERNALRIDAKALEAAIDAKQPYHPEELPFDSEVAKKGTTLVLSELVKKRTKVTAAALRKRLARRFSVFGYRGKGGNNFDVFIDNKKVDHTDRDDLRSLEYLWEFGEKAISDVAVPNVDQRYVVGNNQIPTRPDWVVRGWFGTARKPAELDQDEDAGSMRNIVVLARGRLIQESILDKLGFNRIFGSYVTGLIEADFLDTDAFEDIATSDRQRLIEDDPRVVSLRIFLKQALYDAAETWAVTRRDKKAEDAAKENPALKEWLDDLPEAQRPAAKSMIGLISGLDLDAEREGDRGDLFRSGVLAFERLRLKEAAHNLENLQTLNAAQLLPLLVTQDHYESALYADIVRTRIQAIEQFQHLANSKAKETVLQKHLFENLWLLDPGWERVESSKIMERRLAKDYPKDFAADLTRDEKLGRLDIRYRKNSGTHIIVELKKYERKTNLEELLLQGKKYRAALHKLAVQDGEQSPRIEVVFVLGQPVEQQFSAGLPADNIEKSLALLNGRVVFYDEMITNATKEYQQYLDASEKSDRVGKVLKGIGAPIAPFTAPKAVLAAPKKERMLMPAPARGSEPSRKNIPAKKKPSKRGKKKHK